MFNIPSYYEMPMTFKQATNALIGLDGKNDLLGAMEAMDARWKQHCEAQREDFDNNCDDDWFDCWQYEVNAYNVVFENMSKLFK